MTQRRRPLPILLLALIFQFAAGAVTAEDAAPPKAPEIEASAVIPGTDQVVHEGASAREEAAAILKGLSMMAFVDAETGALGAPTPEEVQQLAAAGQRLQVLSAKTQLTVQEFPSVSGGTAVEVPAELHSHSFVEVTEKGDLHLRCSDTSKIGTDVVANPAAVEEK